MVLLTGVMGASARGFTEEEVVEVRVLAALF
jgi:hypothetical protein